MTNRIQNNELMPQLFSIWPQRNPNVPNVLNYRKPYSTGSGSIRLGVRELIISLTQTTQLPSIPYLRYLTKPRELVYYCQTRHCKLRQSGPANAWTTEQKHVRVLLLQKPSTPEDI